MFSSLSLQDPARYSSLPVVGQGSGWFLPVLEARGYPEKAIRRRIHGSPSWPKRFDASVCDRFREVTARDLMSLRPSPTYWGAHMAGALIRSLTQYLEERGDLATAMPTPSDALARTFTQHLIDVRGLAPQTAERKATESRAGCASAGNDARPKHSWECGREDL